MVSDSRTNSRDRVGDGKHSTQVETVTNASKEGRAIMSSTSRDIAGALNFRSGLLPYANDAAANQATEAELRRTIKFPPENAPGRAINTAMENGGASKVLKQSPQASHYNTTTKDFPERGPKHNHDQELAMDPPTSEAQRKAMWAAKSGHSTLGIPKSVGAEFAKADPGGKLPAKAKDGGPGSGPRPGGLRKALEKPNPALEELNKYYGSGGQYESNKIKEGNAALAELNKYYGGKDGFNARLKDKDNAINVLEKTDPWPSKKTDEKAFGAAAHKTMGRWGGRASDKAGARDDRD